MPIPDNIIAAVNALLAPYGQNFSQPVAATTGGGYLSMKDAAKYAGVSRPTLYRLIVSGQIKQIKLGNTRNAKVVIARDEIDRFMQSRS